MRNANWICKTAFAIYSDSFFFCFMVPDPTKNLPHLRWQFRFTYSCSKFVHVFHVLLSPTVWNRKSWGPRALVLIQIRTVQLIFIFPWNNMIWCWFQLNRNNFYQHPMNLWFLLNWNTIYVLWIFLSFVCFSQTFFVWISHKMIQIKNMMIDLRQVHDQTDSQNWLFIQFSETNYDCEPRFKNNNDKFTTVVTYLPKKIGKIIPMDRLLLWFKLII